MIFKVYLNKESKDLDAKVYAEDYLPKMTNLTYVGTVENEFSNLGTALVIAFRQLEIKDENQRSCVYGLRNFVVGDVLESDGIFYLKTFVFWKKIVPLTTSHE